MLKRLSLVVLPLGPSAAGKAAVERRRAAAIARLHTIEARAGCIPSPTMASLKPRILM